MPAQEGRQGGSALQAKQLDRHCLGHNVSLELLEVLALVRAVDAARRLADACENDARLREGFGELSDERD